MRVGHLPDPYRLDGAYAEGRPMGEVEYLGLSRPDPDRLRPYIESFLRGEGADIVCRCPRDGGGGEVSGC